MTVLKFIFELIFGLLSWWAIFFSTVIAGIASLNYMKTINPIPDIANFIFIVCIFITAANISAFICKKMYFSENKEE